MSGDVGWDYDRMNEIATSETLIHGGEGQFASRTFASLVQQFMSRDGVGGSVLASGTGNPSEEDNFRSTSKSAKYRPFKRSKSDQESVNYTSRQAEFSPKTWGDMQPIVEYVSDRIEASISALNVVIVGAQGSDKKKFKKKREELKDTLEDLNKVNDHKRSKSSKKASKVILSLADKGVKAADEVVNMLESIGNVSVVKSTPQLSPDAKDRLRNNLQTVLSDNNMDEATTKLVVPASDPVPVAGGSYRIAVLGERDLTITGGKLDGVTQGDGSHLVGKEMTLNNGNFSNVTIKDDDLNFEDNDGSQRLDGEQIIDGVTYSDGAKVEAEYSFEVTDGTNTWTMVAFNVNNSSPSYATVEGIAVVDGPGGMPPEGAKLTVTSASEFPNFLATDYLQEPEAGTTEAVTTETGDMYDRMVENLDVPTNTETDGIDMYDRMLANVDVSDRADTAGMSMYDRMLANINVPKRDETAGMELFERMVARIPLAGSQAEADGEGRTTVTTEEFLENIDVPTPAETDGVEMYDRLVENIPLPGSQAETDGVGRTTVTTEEFLENIDVPTPAETDGVKMYDRLVENIPLDGQGSTVDTAAGTDDADFVEAIEEIETTMADVGEVPPAGAASVVENTTTAAALPSAAI